MTSPTSRTPGPVSPVRPAKPPEVEEWVDAHIHRPLASPVVALLLRTPITPNQVTLLSAVVGVGASIALVLGTFRPPLRLVSGLLLIVAVVLDCCDGQLARARGVSSTYGAILDGLADYVVGVGICLSGGYVMATLYGSPWYWLLAVLGLASTAVQSALFDHTKTRYIARVARGYSEREEDLAKVARDRDQAWRERRLKDAFLLWLYHQYSAAQHAALMIPPSPDPAEYRRRNAGRMRAWSWLGVGTHFLLGYVLILASYWWAGALAWFFIISASLLNLLLAALVLLEPRQVGP